MARKKAQQSWLPYCPVCMSTQQVHAIVPSRVGRDPRLYLFACDKCIADHYLLLASGLRPARHVGSGESEVK